MTIMIDVDDRYSKLVALRVGDLSRVFLFGLTDEGRVRLVASRGLAGGDDWTVGQDDLAPVDISGTYKDISAGRYLFEWQDALVGVTIAGDPVFIAIYLSQGQWLMDQSMPAAQEQAHFESIAFFPAYMGVIYGRYYGIGADRRTYSISEHQSPQGFFKGSMIGARDQKPNNEIFIAGSSRDGCFCFGLSSLGRIQILSYMKPSQQGLPVWIVSTKIYDVPNCKYFIQLACMSFDVNQEIYTIIGVNEKGDMYSGLHWSKGDADLKTNNTPICKGPFRQISIIGNQYVAALSADGTGATIFTPPKQSGGEWMRVPAVLPKAVAAFSSVEVSLRYLDGSLEVIGISADGRPYVATRSTNGAIWTAGCPLFEPSRA